MSAPSGNRAGARSAGEARLSSVLLLFISAFFFLFILAVGCATRTAPTATFHGVSPFMTLREARLGLKHQGYIITTRQDQGAFMQYVFVSRDRGAVFPAVDMIICKSDDSVAGLYFSGENEQSVLSAGERQLNLSGVNSVDAVPSGMAAKGGYSPSDKSIYEDVEISFFRVRKAGLWGVALERATSMAGCRKAGVAEVRGEATLFRKIETRLQEAGVSSLIDNTPLGNGTMSPRGNATALTHNGTMPLSVNATAGAEATVFP